jgi:hypothetical protein
MPCVCKKCGEKNCDCGEEYCNDCLIEECWDDEASKNIKAGGRFYEKEEDAQT